MKKIMVVLALASFSLTSMAQEDETPTLKHSVATNSFWSNWFVQANGTYTAFYSNEEKPLDYSQSPFKGFRGNFGLSVAIGKWFTPGIGLRTKLNGFWGKSVLGRYGKGYGDARVGESNIPGDEQKNKIKYFNLQEQAMLNLSNMICGYNPDRVWNFIPYAGVGAVRNCSYNTWELAFSAGVLNTLKLTDRLKLNLDINYNMCGDDFEGEGNVWGGHSQENHDHWFTAEVGLTFALGKTIGWNKVPDVDALKALNQAQLDALNAQLNDANNEIGRLRNMLDNMPEPQTTVIDNTVKEFITTPVSVFFNLDKTEIAVLKDLVNVRALAKFAKENNRSILVTGYADSATGSVKHNQWLSEKRAERVANELINMGIEPSKITTAAKGGVDILTPIDFNRRATVQITEE